MIQCHAVILGVPLKEYDVILNLASKPSVSSGTAALTLARESLESGEYSAGVAFIIVSRVHTHHSMGRIMLIKMAEGKCMQYCDI